MLPAARCAADHSVPTTSVFCHLCLEPTRPVLSPRRHRDLNTPLTGLSDNFDPRVPPPGLPMLGQEGGLAGNFPMTHPGVALLGAMPSGGSPGNTMEAAQVLQMFGARGAVTTQVPETPKTSRPDARSERFSNEWQAQFGPPPAPTPDMPFRALTRTVGEKDTLVDGLVEQIRGMSKDELWRFVELSKMALIPPDNTATQAAVTAERSPGIMPHPRGVPVVMTPQVAPECGKAGYYVQPALSATAGWCASTPKAPVTSGTPQRCLLGGH